MSWEERIAGRLDIAPPPLGYSNVRFLAGGRSTQKGRALATRLPSGSLLVIVQHSEAGESLHELLPWVVLALSVTAGVTAARGQRAGPRWLVLAWSVPVLPGVLAVAAFTWLARISADPLAVVLLVYLTVPLWTGVVVAFLAALAAELVRLHLRRRRFAPLGPAWENGPPPPSYS